MLNHTRQMSSSILGVILVMLTASGCARVTTYDLSAKQPFSKYVGKEVILTRDILIVDVGRPELPGQFYDVLDPSSPDQRANAQYQMEAKAHLRYVRIPVGTKIHVLDVHLVNSSNVYTSWWFLYSTVSFDSAVVGWPQPILARFNYATAKDNDWGPPQGWMLHGTIRPAPWEPLDTPALRPLDVRQITEGLKGVKRRL